MSDRDEGEFALLDEIQDLLEKEKAVYEYELQQKQDELDKLSNQVQASGLSEMDRELSLRKDRVFETLEYINLSNQNLVNRDLSTLVNQIQWMKKVQTLNLEGNLFDDQARASLPSLLQLNQLIHLNLSRNSFGFQVLEQICAYLIQPEASLRVLIMHSNPFSHAPHVGLYLNKYLSQFPLDHFHVSLADFASQKQAKHLNNALHFVKQKRVATKVKSKAKLQVHFSSLGLSGTQLSASSLTELMKNFKTLTNLNLSSSFIGSSGIQILGKHLNSWKMLIRLNLASNGIRDKGIEVFCQEGLHMNESLTHLNLCNNELTDVGIRHLTKSLQGNSRLLQLPISGNYIDSKGAKALLKYAKRNPQLVQLGAFDSILTIPIPLKHQLHLQLHENQTHVEILRTPSPTESLVRLENVQLYSKENSTEIFQLKAILPNSRLRVHWELPDFLPPEALLEYYISMSTKILKHDFHPSNQKEMTLELSFYQKITNLSLAMKFSSRASSDFSLQQVLVERQEISQDTPSSSPFFQLLSPITINYQSLPKLIHQIYIASPADIIIQWELQIVMPFNLQFDSVDLNLYEFYIFRQRNQQLHLEIQGTFDSFNGSFNTKRNSLQFATSSTNWQEGDYVCFQIQSGARSSEQVYDVILASFTISAGQSSLNQSPKGLNFVLGNPFEADTSLPFNLEH